MTATTFAQSLDQIAHLVAYYRINRDAFHAATYKEAQARKELIDPLFIALGWDLHPQNIAPDYQQVIVEESRPAGGSQRAPDYTFRMSRDDRKFFVEAKKPGVNLKSNAAAAYQLRNYGWNAKLTVSLLTDFEEFAVYNCRRKPRESDKPNVSRLQYFTYDEYPDRWRELWDVFSLDAIRGGAFDQYAGTAKSERSALSVDADFLATIEGWRKALAQNIEANSALHADDLTDAVQRLIDRLVFLRIAEDREIEPFGALAEAAEGDGVYRALLALFRKADRKYNAGLFDFAKDKLSQRLVVDDKPLKAVVRDLYGAYNFRIMPVEILGNVYEQFLGKVIRVTAGGTVKIEDKPEVRKAGGVYYTPAYIVEYIVRQTVGKALEGKSPKEVAKLRVLDMACGSGSFLLGAYQFLLDWHLQWYVAHEPRKQSSVYDAAHGAGEVNWRLTTEAKKRVLLNNIYGVDIDRQAVEVTKLSLLLKVLEDESRETLQPQLIERDGERALPNLDANIRCGNSLIGPDYFADGATPDTDELKRINPFDWKAAFPAIMRDGGFDVVIGNPPYVRIQTLNEFAPEQVEAFKRLYRAAGSGNYDIYVVFVEKGLSLLNLSGRLGFILPHKFFNAKYGEPLRGLISEGKHLSQVIHFGDQQVFDGATTYTCLLFLDKAGCESFDMTRVSNLNAWRTGEKQERGKVSAVNVTAVEWNFAIGKGAALFEKLDRMPVKLRDVSTGMFVGLQTSADTVFLFKDHHSTDHNIAEVFSKELGEWTRLELSILKRVVRSGSVGRYKAETTAYVLLPYSVSDNVATLKPETEMRRTYPLAWKYLTRNKKFLESREKSAFKDMQWYRFGRNQNLGMWEQPKLLVPYMVTELSAYPDMSDNLYFINVTTGGYGITVNEKQVTYLYLCGLLNSRLLDMMLKQVSTTFHGGYFAANKQFIEQLPIRTINFSDPADKARHDQMVALVERMLELHKRLHAAASDAERAVLQNQIAATDRLIDALVYDLYALTLDEIRIVEGGAA